MRLLDFFRKPVYGLFVQQEPDGRGAFDTVKVDYILSRSLYASAPASSGGFSDYGSYVLGNYCTKSYIDMFSWFIGLPEITAESDAFTADIQTFLSRNKNNLLSIYRQTMIDGKHFVWVRTERDLKGKSTIKIKQIPRENVKDAECIKDAYGNYTRFVIETVEKWKDGTSDKKAVIRIELTASKEVITIQGDLPPHYASKRIETANNLSFVPVYCLYNNKQPDYNTKEPFVL